MKLIVTSVTMVDLTNKEAKKIHFSQGKNLLTSERNHLGKSVIMKSIYYSLGAEVYFPAPIKKINLLTYLDFKLGDHSYRISRLNGAFTVYSDGVFMHKYSTVNSLGGYLAKLFDLEINLVGKDAEGSITRCPPAFYYLPYYVDQENGWAANSTSFNNMGQFDLPQRRNSYFFHLGALDTSFVEESKNKKTNDRKIGLLTKENEDYKIVISTLQMGIDEAQMSFDSQSLERAINTRQNEIRRILEDIAKARRVLIEAEDRLVQLTHDKAILAKYIKSKAPNVQVSKEDIIECPRCGIFFERALTEKIEKTYLLESLHDDYTTISKDLDSLQKRIEKLKKNFGDKQDLLVKYEKSLAENQETYDAYMKSKATSQLLLEYQAKVGANTAEIDLLNKENKETNKLLREYGVKKTQTNQQYVAYLTPLLGGLDVPDDQVEKESEPGSALDASGAYGPRCKVAQMLAFVQTQKRINPNVISFPLVIDSPNVLEQDSEHLVTVLQTLLTWEETDNQIIVASIEGKTIARAIAGVNVITLDNPKNHLFTKKEYQSNEEEIAEIFTNF